MNRKSNGTTLWQLSLTLSSPPSCTGFSSLEEDEQEKKKAKG